VSYVEWNTVLLHSRGMCYKHGVTTYQGTSNLRSCAGANSWTFLFFWKVPSPQLSFFREFASHISSFHNLMHNFSP
jgi:hypothetical protein